MKEWIKPEVEELSVLATMGGTGNGSENGKGYNYTGGPAGNGPATDPTTPTNPSTGA